MPATPHSDRHAAAGHLVAGLLLAAAGIEALVFATSWAGAAAWLAGGGLAVRHLAGLAAVAGLAASLLLPIAGRHWPGLLSGRRWRVVGGAAYGLFAVALAAFSATFYSAGPAGDQTWSAAIELRANALYCLLMLLLALPLLFGARGPERTTRCDSGA